MTQAPTPGPLSVGNLHTAIMEALAEDIQRQRPDAFREEDENGFEGDLVIPTGVTPASAYAVINVSELAEVVLPIVSPTAPVEASWLDEIDLYDDKVQTGIAWTMRQWGETLGLTTWTQGDGSESVEGDVGAEIHTILIDAGLRDPETNEMAALRPQPSGETREDRLSAALIAMVEHFERVDAAPEDKAAIQAACEVWAGVKRDKALPARPLALGGQHSGGETERQLERLQAAFPKAVENGVGRGMTSASHTTPARAKAPSEDDARRRLIQRIEQWDGEMEYDAEDIAALADDILHEFNGAPVVARAEALDEGAATDDLVDRFAVALKAKLRAAGEKYGFDDAWKADDWRDKLIEDLLRHIQKGDPRDVAAYCAFAWHHDWSLSPKQDDLRSAAFTDRGAEDRYVSQDEGAAGKWPEVTDQWAETYCDLTGQNPDGVQVSFIGDGAVTTTFRDKAKRQIEAMLCAAPKAAVRAISAHPSPTPAADEDRVRIAVEAIKAEINAPLTGPTHGAWDRGRIAGLKEALAALKTEGK